MMINLILRVFGNEHRRWIAESCHLSDLVISRRTNAQVVMLLDSMTHVNLITLFSPFNLISLNLSKFFHDFSEYATALGTCAISALFVKQLSFLRILIFLFPNTIALFIPQAEYAVFKAAQKENGCRIRMLSGDDKLGTSIASLGIGLRSDLKKSWY